MADTGYNITLVKLVLERPVSPQYLKHLFNKDVPTRSGSSRLFVRNQS